MNLTKGHNNLTKLNEIASCICGRFCNENIIWLWIGIFISSRNFIIFLCFQNEILRMSSITKEKIIATLLNRIIAHNNLDLDHAFCYPQVSSLRFEQFKTPNPKLGRA